MPRHRLWGFVLAGLGAGLLSLPIWIGPAARVAAQNLPRATPGQPVTDRVRTTAVPRLPEPPTGHEVADLIIPALQLNVPVLQGTAFGQLLFAPGHYAGSVLPGESGASVIAAHNDTFFHHLDRLHPGSLIIVQTEQGIFRFAVTRSAVVSDTAGLPDTSTPTLDLEACYPLNALYFTPKRYIVFSRLIGADRAPANPLPSAPTAGNPFSAAIPAAITDHYSLALSNNSLPMGQLTYAAPDKPAVVRFEESPRPLQAETVAIALWLAYVDAVRSGDVEALTALVPGANQSSNPYWLARSVIFEAPLNVTLAVSPGGIPTSFTLSDDLIRVNGAPY